MKFKFKDRVMVVNNFYGCEFGTVISFCPDTLNRVNWYRIKLDDRSSVELVTLPESDLQPLIIP